MADIDPRILKERQRVKQADERLAKAKQREQRIAAEVQVAQRKAEITQAVHRAVNDALNGLKLDVPAEGITLFVHKGDNGIGVDVKLGKKRSGNDNRRTITALGHSGFVLPDGTKVGSAAKLLDHFGHPHKGDSAARLILTWAEANPEKAATVQVVINGKKVPLTEAVQRI